MGRHWTWLYAPLLACAYALAQADYQIVFSHDDGVFGVDAASITRQGSDVKAWWMFNPTHAQEINEPGAPPNAMYVSSKGQMSLDCKGGGGRMLQVAYFSELNAGGRVVFRRTNPSDKMSYVDPIPNSSEEAIVKFVCARAGAN